MSNDVSTLQNIRARLQRFITVRQRAYEVSVKKGFVVPAYREKLSALIMLRVQMQASEGWDLQGNLRWICSMRNYITLLLPSEFNEDARQRVYRKHMTDLLSYCELLLDSKPMFKSKPTSSCERQLELLTTPRPTMSVVR